MSEQQELDVAMFKHNMGSCDSATCAICSVDILHGGGDMPGPDSKTTATRIGDALMDRAPPTFVGFSLPADPVTISELVAERDARYGGYARNAELCQRLKNEVRKFSGFHELPPTQKESIDMIFHKIARAVNGNHSYADNWVDIEGYAHLVSKELAR